MTVNIKEYRKQGFYIARGLNSEVQARALLQKVYQLFHLQLCRFEPSLESNPDNLYSEMQKLLKHDVNAYLAAARRSSKLVDLHRYLSHDNILSALSDLAVELPTVVTEPILHINADKLAIPGGYMGFAPHQDWPSIQGSLDCVVVWAPLVEINDVNFPLQVIPNSHKNGLLKGKETANLYEVDPTLYNSDDFISINVKPGDVIFMSSWTVHRTGINNSHGFRMACSTRYDNCTEQTFIDRGFPCAYKRSVERKLITPSFPTTENITRLFK